jgi:hypothetical protein
MFYLFVPARHRLLWLILFCLTGLSPYLRAQTQERPFPDTIPEPDTRKLALAATGLGLTYSTGLYYLSKTWYSEPAKSGFHFFNDNRQWKQMDKAGHFWGAFHEGRLGIDALKAARIPEKKAIWYGGLLGFVLQAPVEWLDGYAAGYGASAGDLGANALGALALISQELAWGEVRIRPAFSFHRTRLAPLRPRVLGDRLPEEILKDYNGQTYWLSVEVASFLPAPGRYPRWLNLAFGYGAEDMVYGSPGDNRQAGYHAYRQYYLALDVNFRYLRPRSKFLKGALWILDMVHLPAPAVEYNRRQGLRLHPIYF